MKFKKIDVLLLGILAVITLVFWWFTKDIPYWWDSAGFVIVGAHKVLEHNFLLLDLGLPGAYPHTTFFVVLLALLWRIFGESLLISHLLMLFFTGLTLFFMYRLTDFLAGGKLSGKLAGLFAGILLLFTPVFYAQVGIIYMEIPIAAFALMTVFYYLRKNTFLYLLCATLMVYTKDVSVFLLLVILGYELLQTIITAVSKNVKISAFSLLKKLFILALPLGLLFFWFLSHRITTGWWYVPPSAPWAGPKSISPEAITTVFYFFFVDQWRILTTILLAFLLEETLVKEKFHKYVLRLPILLILLVPITTALFFGMTEFLQRYIVIGLPFYYLLITYLFSVIYEKKSLRTQIILFTLITAVISIFFYTQWNLKRQITYWYYPPLEENLEYKDVIAAGQAMSQYVEKHYPHAKILTSFPANYMLALPYQHYVTHALKTKDCNKVQPGDKFDLVIFHPFSPISQYCLAIMNVKKLKPYKTFEKNGKFFSIYGP